jgi:GR25 family glycosyltransferase involved in LPS biosynthesis
MISGIFCLSLERDILRREHFKNAFGRFGIPLTFHLGIDASKNKIEIPYWLEQIKTHKLYSDEIRRSIAVLNKDLTKAEKACAIGHLGIWYEISQMKENQFYLVCEDDAVPKNSIEFIQQLNLVISEINYSDFTYCGYITSKGDVSKKTSLHLFWHWFKQQQWKSNLNTKVKFNLSTVSLPKKVLFKKHIQKAGMHWGAFGYLITPKIAKELISLNCDLKMTSDGTFRYALLCNLMPMYVAKKGIIIVNKNHPSNIRSISEHEDNFKNFDFG